VLGGDDDWSWSTYPTPYYGDTMARSADVDDYEESVMTTAGYGPGMVSFYWRVSSEEDYDYLEFYLDDELQDRISGISTSWQLKSYNVTGEGKHTFEWRYVKDGSSYDGNDRGYVDYLQWTGDAEPESSEWAEIEYTYDPSGRRIAKDVDGTVTKYVYDGDHCIAEYDGSDNLLRRYIYGPGVDQPICMIDVEDSNAVYYYHYDALGSVVALSDSDGDTVQVYEYDVYGQVAASDPNHPNPFLFTGRRYDTETGLYYYRARYYNASIGRFLQTDPIGYAGGINLYAYCRNNSVCCADPYGLFELWPTEPTGRAMVTIHGKTPDYSPEPANPFGGGLIIDLDALLELLRESMQAAGEMSGEILSTMDDMLALRSTQWAYRVFIEVIDYNDRNGDGKITEDDLQEDETLADLIIEQRPDDPSGLHWHEVSGVMAPEDYGTAGWVGDRGAGGYENPLVGWRAARTAITDLRETGKINPGHVDGTQNSDALDVQHVYFLSEFMEAHMQIYGEEAVQQAIDLLEGDDE